MTGQTPPKYKTDDIRRSVETLTEYGPVRAVVTTGILASSLALLVQSFGPAEWLEIVCDQVITWSTALFAIDISMRLIGQRVGFFGKPGNVAVFLIVGLALFTPFNAVLMLRLFPVLKNGAWGYRLPRLASIPLMIVWLSACIAAGARSAVLHQGETCAGWVGCLRSAFQLTLG